MSDEKVGLIGKFHVERVDGRDKPGRDKAHARYFVLDYVHDDHAQVALLKYADSVAIFEPALARDLYAAIREVRHLYPESFTEAAAPSVSPSPHLVGSDQ